MSRPCDAWADACVDAAEGRASAPFARHLEACAGCREAVHELGRDLAALAPDDAPVPGPWLATSVRRAAEAKRQGRRSRLVVFGPMAAAAAGLVLLLTVATAGRYEGRWATGHPDAVADAVAPRTALTEDDDLDGLDPFDLDWDAGWGVGLDTILDGASAADLERLVDRLSFAGTVLERSPEP